MTKSTGNKTTWLKIVTAVAMVAALIAAGSVLDIAGPLKGALEWVDSLGTWGPLFFIGIYIVATVLFLPGSLLTLGAGLVFGVVKGSLIVSVAATLGASLAFLVSRYVARGWVSRKFKGNEKFQRIDHAVGKNGWKIVALSRLSPIFPFNVLNYAYGLTGVSFPAYALASWVGMIPGTITYVYVGSLAGSLAQIGSEGARRPAGMWALYGVGLVATIAVTIYVTSLANSAMRSKSAAKS